MEKEHYIYEDIEIRYDDYIDNIPNWDPYYIYTIHKVNESQEIGRIVFRLGTDESLLYAGHIGYTIEENYRGHHYAYKACLALKEKIKAVGYSHVLITCSPENSPSKKTIEKLQCEYLETKMIPKSLKKEFTIDEKAKMIYKWKMD